MFNERMALKMRLEDLKGAEKKILAEIRAERSFVMNRLRELDELEKHEKSLDIKNKNIDALDCSIHVPPSRTRKGRPSRRSKTSKMRETTINILKEQTTPIRAKDLQKRIEDSTGFQIANMTTFMNTIQKTDEYIIKVSRGLYIYQDQQSN